MNTRVGWMVGVTALGLVLTAPVHAAPDFMDGAFIVAKRDQVDEIRQDQHAARRDSHRASKREGDREEPQGYGYGYERRQQERSEQDRRPRDRR